MKILQLGAGKSGISLAKLLKQESHDITLVNEKDFIEREILIQQGIDVCIMPFDCIDLKKYDLVYKSPGVPGFNEIALTETHAAKTIVDDYHLYAITGTNGKTTTTSLLEKMLRKKDKNAFAAGNIGYPLAQAVLDKGKKEVDVALELSSFQLDGLKDIQLETYALMNLSPDHLDRYESLEAYYQSKLNGIKLAKNVIVNIDDPILNQYEYQQNVLRLSLNKRADIYQDNQVLYFKNHALLDLSKLKILGKHNQYNVAFAATTACIAGVSIDDIQSVAYNFTGVEHRMEYVGYYHHRYFYNDSKATSPESTVVCLESFKDQKVLLLIGGSDKNISYELLETVKERVKKAYIFGETKHKIEGIFNEDELFEDMESAFNKALEDSCNEDIIVLSPASASFDLFINYEERGRIFKELVKTLK